MSLYDPDRDLSQVAPEDQLLSAHYFLQRARAWAVEHGVPRAERRLADDPTPEHASKLRDWLTYVAFTEHALAELEDGRLDDWFTG